MARRLRLMPEVAAWKFLHNKPVEDGKREEDLLRILEREGVKSGLRPGFIRVFFQHQFDGAKLLQKRSISQLKEKNTRIKSMDLNRDLRPEISELSGNMLNQLSQFMLSRASFKEMAGDLEAHKNILAEFDEDIVDMILLPLRVRRL